MQAGKLDRVVTIQQYTPSRDAAGGEIKSWADVATVRAEKRDLSGRELVQANREDLSETFTTWIIRYRSDVTPKMRLVDGTTNYDILNLSEIGRKWGLELQCKRSDV